MASMFVTLLHRGEVDLEIQHANDFRSLFFAHERIHSFLRVGSNTLICEINYDLHSLYLPGNNGLIREVILS